MHENCSRRLEAGFRGGTARVVFAPVHGILRRLPVDGGNSARPTGKLSAILRVYPGQPSRFSLLLPQEPSVMFDRNLTLSKADPDVWAAVQKEDVRQEQHIELIASENYASPPSWKPRARSSRTSTPKATRQALLRRLRIRGRGRAAGHRSPEADLRRRSRQCAAQLGLAGQPGRVHGRALAGRHRAGHEPGRRRPPDARRVGQRLGQAVQLHLVWPGRQRSPELRPGRKAGQGTQAQADRGRRLGLRAAHRLRAHGPHRP